jgi:hypothetical protein
LRSFALRRRHIRKTATATPTSAATTSHTHHVFDPAELLAPELAFAAAMVVVVVVDWARVVGEVGAGTTITGGRVVTGGCVTGDVGGGVVGGGFVRGGTVGRSAAVGGVAVVGGGFVRGGTVGRSGATDDAGALVALGTDGFRVGLLGRVAIDSLVVGREPLDPCPPEPQAPPNAVTRTNSAGTR